MQSPRTGLTPSRETRQSPRTKPVSHLAPISHSPHEHPDTPWGRFPTLFQTNPKVGGPYHRFVQYLEVISRLYPHFSGLQSCRGIFREEHPTWTHWIQYIVRFFQGLRRSAPGGTGACLELPLANLEHILGRPWEPPKGDKIQKELDDCFVQQHMGFLVNLKFWLYTLDLSHTGNKSARVGARWLGWLKGVLTVSEAWDFGNSGP